MHTMIGFACRRTYQTSNIHFKPTEVLGECVWVCRGKMPHFRSICAFLCLQRIHAQYWKGFRPDIRICDHLLRPIQSHFIYSAHRYRFTGPGLLVGVLTNIKSFFLFLISKCWTDHQLRELCTAQISAKRYACKLAAGHGWAS